MMKSSWCLSLDWSRYFKPNIQLLHAPYSRQGNSIFEKSSSKRSVITLSKLLHFIHIPNIFLPISLSRYEPNETPQAFILRVCVLLVVAQVNIGLPLGHRCFKMRHGWRPINTWLYHPANARSTPSIFAAESNAFFESINGHWQGVCQDHLHLFVAVTAKTGSISV